MERRFVFKETMRTQLLEVYATRSEVYDTERDGLIAGPLLVRALLGLRGALLVRLFAVGVGGRRELAC